MNQTTIIQTTENESYIQTNKLLMFCLEKVMVISMFLSYVEMEIEILINGKD